MRSFLEHCAILVPPLLNVDIFFPIYYFVTKLATLMHFGKGNMMIKARKLEKRLFLRVPFEQLDGHVGEGKIQIQICHSIALKEVFKKYNFSLFLIGKQKSNFSKFIIFKRLILYLPELYISIGQPTIIKFYSLVCGYMIRKSEV